MDFVVFIVPECLLVRRGCYSYSEDHSVGGFSKNNETFSSLDTMCDRIILLGITFSEQSIFIS